MKKKLVLIVLLAACFGWGFASLVELSDNSIRPADTSFGCQDWQSC